MNDSKIEMHIYKEGFRAYKEGFEMSDNPYYRKDYVMMNFWQLGFQHAEMNENKH